MSIKEFKSRSILKPEKSLEEEQEEKRQKEERDLSKKTAPTSVLDGMNDDKYSRAMRKAITLDILSQNAEDEVQKQDEEWAEEIGD